MDSPSPGPKIATESVAVGQVLRADRLPGCEHVDREAALGPPWLGAGGRLEDAASGAADASASVGGAASSSSIGDSVLTSLLSLDAPEAWRGASPPSGARGSPCRRFRRTQLHTRTWAPGTWLRAASPARPGSKCSAESSTRTLRPLGTSKSVQRAPPWVPMYSCTTPMWNARRTALASRGWAARSEWARAPSPGLLRSATRRGAQRVAARRARSSPSPRPARLRMVRALAPRGRSAQAGSATAEGSRTASPRVKRSAPLHPAARQSA
jgi:hypothetical protein